MRLLRPVVAVVVMTLLLGADWPQFLGPQRNGTCSEVDLLDRWPAAGPPLVWQRAIGEGYASPVVAAGKLVVFHRVGDLDTTECLDAATGKAIWKSTYATSYDDALGKGNGPRATPLIAAGRVYTLGAAGQLRCLALETGKLLWRRDLLEAYQPRPSFFGVATTPLLEGKRLLLNVGGEQAGIVALDSDTGKELWRATDHEASYASPIAATIDGVRHVFFFTREGLVALDPESGKVRFGKRWRSRMHASVNAASPVLLGGDHLFLSACYQTGAVLLKVRKDGVEEVWKNDESLSCHFGTPVVVGEQLYGFHGRQEEGGQLRCIDWKTGKVRWSDDGHGCGSLIAVKDRLLVLGENGKLTLAAATPRAFTALSSAAVLGRPCRAPMALADGLLFAHDGRKLVCLKVR